MKFLLQIFAMVLAMFLIGGCASDTAGNPDTTSSSSVTGQFVDDPVSGLTYECSSGTVGVTGLEGEYTCEEGDNVTFSIGGVLIGTVTAEEGIVTPYSFFPDNQDAALNIARLLQSVDTNTSDDIITLDAALVALLDVATDFESPTFVADVEADLGITLVSVEEAQTQLNETIANAGEDIPDGANIPVADAGPDQNVHNNDVVTLDGSASNDTDGDALDYNWTIVSIPGGSSVTLSDRTAVNPTFTPDESGSYIVELVVNDGSADSAPDDVNITATVGNATPIADAGVDQNVQTTDTVDLDGSGSSDADLDALSYTWTILSKPANSDANLSDETLEGPTFEADLDGDYEIQLIVNDGTVDSVPDTMTVTATTANIAPVADAGPDQYLATGSTVTLDGSGSSDANFDGLTYSWSVAKPDNSTLSLSSVNPTFTADLSGVYTVSLLVNDGSVNSNTADSVLITATTVAAVPTHNGFDYIGVVSPYTGRIWLDRNLGADRACNAYNDTSCYGDYYQWGRGTDGHQLSNSTTSSIQLNEVNSTSSAFITAGDWVGSGIDDSGAIRIANWSDTTGASVCPTGYRVPTTAEITIETTSQGVDTYFSAYTNFLSLPSAGSRYYNDGNLQTVAYGVLLWSGSLDTTITSKASYFYALNPSGAGTTSSFEGEGRSVRCIKDY